MNKNINISKIFVINLSVLKLLFSFLGSGIERSDDKVFLIEGDIRMKEADLEDKVEKNEKSRKKRAVINIKETLDRDLWTKNISYAINLCMFKVQFFYCIVPIHRLPMIHTVFIKRSVVQHSSDYVCRVGYPKKMKPVQNNYVFA